MEDFRSIIELNSEIGFHRVRRMRRSAGFDLFSDEMSVNPEYSALLLTQPSSQSAELRARAFDCFAQSQEETPVGWFFADGPTLEEYVLSEINAKNFQALAESLGAVWSLFSRLARAGLEIQTFHPSEILAQSSRVSQSAEQRVWRILPTANVCFSHTSNAESGSAFRWNEGQIGMLNWIRTLEERYSFRFSETIQELLRWAFLRTPSNWQIQALETPVLWSIRVPGPPFFKLRLSRQERQVALRWSCTSSEENSKAVLGDSTDLMGKLRLFELKSDVKLPASGTLLPENALSYFFEREFPVAERNTEAILELRGNGIQRLCGGRTLGMWTRVGGVFRTGGPEDVTIFDCYWNEDALVLDLDWPESIRRVKILISPHGFVAGPNEDSTRSGSVRVWWHDRFNPLVPKLIPAKEFVGWKKIYVRVFSFIETEGKGIFSLGQSPKSRMEVPPQN